MCKRGGTIVVCAAEGSWGWLVWLGCVWRVGAGGKAVCKAVCRAGPVDSCGYRTQVMMWVHRRRVRSGGGGLQPNNSQGIVAGGGNRCDVFSIGAVGNDHTAESSCKMVYFNIGTVLEFDSVLLCCLRDAVMVEACGWSGAGRSGR